MSQDITAPLEDDADSASEVENEAVLGDGYIIDCISGEKRVKDTPKEQVRQFIAKALANEYGISFEDMEADFPIGEGKRRKTVDIAIFHPQHDHKIIHMSRAVICRPTPQVGRTIKLRDYNEAEKDLKVLKEIMEEVETCQYGLWTNGLDLFYLKREQTRFDIRLEPIADWPMAGESEKLHDPTTRTQMHLADEDMLRVVFRRCHNFIHGNEGMAKDRAFWQFLYLIFCKMHDEEAPRHQRKFWVGLTEQFTPEGREKIRERIIPLFAEVKQKIGEIFRGNEEITLSPPALAFMVSELSRYDFTNSEIDAKGAAYQEIVGINLRGDRGQYFTPRGVVKLAVEILDPKEYERVFDPACGTGGFLRATLSYMHKKFCAEEGLSSPHGDSPLHQEVRARLKAFAGNHIFGADFDPDLVKASQMNMVMSGDGRAHLYYMNSLEFPRGYLAGLERAKQDIPFESLDVIMTNPPFGTKIQVTDSNILKQYELARWWRRNDEGGFRKDVDKGPPDARGLQSSVAPEILFIERCLQWLKPGGRMGIVLPDGILSNPGTEYIRYWILQNAWVLASIDLPVEIFIVDANVNILTSLLFLKKKTAEEMRAESLGGMVEYPVFMAIAEKVGFDRRGNKIYKREPDGEEKIVVVKEETVYVQVDGKLKPKPRKEYGKLLDDDLPEISRKYREFRERYLEPGR